MLNEFIRYLKRFRREKSLIISLNNELKKLRSSIGNQKQLVIESRHIIFIISQLEKTEVYWFIKEDVSRVKAYIKKLNENPKNKGVVYFLTSFYIVAPGTFEATGIILFFRYMWRLFKKGKINK